MLIKLDAAAQSESIQSLAVLHFSGSFLPNCYDYFECINLLVGFLLCIWLHLVSFRSEYTKSNHNFSGSKSHSTTTTLIIITTANTWEDAKEKDRWRWIIDDAFIFILFTHLFSFTLHPAHECVFGWGFGRLNRSSSTLQFSEITTLNDLKLLEIVFHLDVSDAWSYRFCGNLTVLDLAPIFSLVFFSMQRVCAYLAPLHRVCSSAEDGYFWWAFRYKIKAMSPKRANFLIATNHENAIFKL